MAPSTAREAVDTEATARIVVAAEDIHSIGHVAPYRCVGAAGRRRGSARGQLTPAIGLAKVAQVFRNYKQSIDSKCLSKIQSRFSFYKNGVGHLAAIYPNSCFSSFHTAHWSLRRVEMHLYSHETSPNLMAPHYCKTCYLCILTDLYQEKNHSKRIGKEKNVMLNHVSGS